MSHVSLWRIATTAGKYRADDLSGAGAGAAAVGGRYNSPGTAVVYASSCVALAVLETVVHFAAPATAQANRYLIEIVVPRAVYEARQVLEVDALHKRHPFWDAVPFAEVSQRIGDAWCAATARPCCSCPAPSCRAAGCRTAIC